MGEVTREMLLMKVSALANGSIAPQSVMQAIDAYVEALITAARAEGARRERERVVRIVKGRAPFAPFPEWSALLAAITEGET